MFVRCVVHPQSSLSKNNVVIFKRPYANMAND